MVSEIQCNKCYFVSALHWYPAEHSAMKMVVWQACYLKGKSFMKRNYVTWKIRTGRCQEEVR